MALTDEAHPFSGNELRDIVDWPHTGILGLGQAEGRFVFTDYNAVVNVYYDKALCDMAALAEALGEAGMPAIRQAVKTPWLMGKRVTKKIEQPFASVFYLQLLLQMVKLVKILIMYRCKP